MCQKKNQPSSLSKDIWMRDTKRSDSIIKMPELAYFPQEVLKSEYGHVGRW